MKNNSKKGFTLVEIMIVVVIIGLLAAMAIPAFQKVRQNSQDKTIINNLRQLNAAAQQYFLEHGVTSVTTTQLVGTDSTEKYIKSIQAVRQETYDSPITATQTQLGLASDDNNPSGSNDLYYKP
jgi:type IV pilus assembly protein PilA